MKDEEDVELKLTARQAEWLQTVAECSNYHESTEVLEKVKVARSRASATRRLRNLGLPWSAYRDNDDPNDQHAWRVNATLTSRPDGSRCHDTIASGLTEEQACLIAASAPLAMMVKNLLTGHVAVAELNAARTLLDQAMWPVEESQDDGR